MTEFSAQQSKIAKIKTAAQSIQERIVCGICLDTFDEPVTLKCGHRFCRRCILRVTKNENSACPFCNKKIRKRSIPTEGNKLFQLFVNQCLSVIKALKEDSGIDVLEPCSKTKNTKESVPLNERPKTKNTKESVPLNERPSTSRFEQSSNISKGSSTLTAQKSTNSRSKSQSSKRNSVTKKQVNKNSGSTENTLHKYLESNTSNDKVSNWLNTISPHIADDVNSDSNNEDDSPLLKKDNEKFKVPEVSESPQFAKSAQSRKFNNHPSTSKAKEPELDESVNRNVEELKYKETQSRIQELEMVARRKKLNSNLTDKNVLKTTNSVPAATHSDIQDWRRVKKIGKEMQANTFKSLNVSVEKSSSSVAGDDNMLATSSAINDNKNKQKLLKAVDNSYQTETPKANNSSMNTTDSHKGENFSTTFADQEQINEIIGISSELGDLRIPRKIKNRSKIFNKENTSKVEQSKSVVKNSENDSEDNLQKSPSIHKLSFKKNLTNTEKSKLLNPQSGTSEKTNQSENNSPRKISPERPKSRLSLRISSAKISDQSSVEQSKPAVLNHNVVQSTITNHNFHNQNPDTERKSSSSRGRRIPFKKLGKISKKQKNVPFIQLGKVQPKRIRSTDNQQSSVLVKSNVPVYFEINPVIVNNSKPSIPTSDIPTNKEMEILSPEEDSQLKYLAIESPHRQKDETTYQDKSDALMEVDPIPPIESESHVLVGDDKASSTHHAEKPDLQKSNNFTTNEKVHDKLKNVNDFQVVSTEKDIEDIFESNLIKPSTSKICHSKIKTPLTTLSGRSSPSSHSEAREGDEESVHSESNQNSSPVKATAAESEIEEQNVLSLGVKDHDKFCRNPSVQNIVGNYEANTERERNVYSEVESNVNIEIQNKPVKRNVFSSSTVNSANKYSEVESSSDSDASDAKTQSKSRKTSSSSVSTTSSVSESIEVSEAESKALSDFPKIRRNIRKTSCSRVAKEVLKDDTTTDIHNPKVQSKSKKTNSSSGSTLSSIKRTSNKKRTRSDSSNDDEDFDVTSIIGKWCGNDVQISKKTKVLNSTCDIPTTEQDETKLIPMEDDDDLDVTLVGDENQMDSRTIQRDPPIDDIISKVKNLKEAELNQSKLVAIPSSLMSAELFESNEPCMQPSAQVSPKQVDSEAMIDKSQDEIDTTLVDMIQTTRKKSQKSESSDGSNKENNMSNKVFPSVREENSEDQVNEIENSHSEKSNKIMNNLNSETDAYHISESLMDITQQQLALKRIEKDLIGIDLSTIHDNKNKVQNTDQFSTPQGKRKETRNIDENEKEDEDDFYPDNIDGTPCVKKSRKSIRDALPNQLLAKFNTGSEINSSEIFSPVQDMPDLIPAITPVKNRKSYPLCHSTPVVNANNSENLQPTMVLVCSGLQADQTKIVQAFVKHFNGKFQAAFTMDVTHVIISTEPETKIGQRTFKYIQGIAFQKHVINFQWVLDCLAKNALLDEEDEKYEVLDGDVLESGAKKSRQRQQGIFDSFAFLCLEPFSALSIDEFKNILTYNDAVVVESLARLAAQNNKYRIIIITDDYDLTGEKLNAFKETKSALVSFDWVVDSISQYHAISIAPYLQETAPAELKEWGFPEEYLVEEDDVEEDEGDELE